MQFLAPTLQQKRYNKVNDEKYLERYKKIYDAPYTTFIGTSIDCYLPDVWCDECWVYFSPSTV